MRGKDNFRKKFASSPIKRKFRLYTALAITLALFTVQWIVSTASGIERRRKDDQARRIEEAFQKEIKLSVEYGAALDRLEASKKLPLISAVVRHEVVGKTLRRHYVTNTRAARMVSIFGKWFDPPVVRGTGAHVYLSKEEDEVFVLPHPLGMNETCVLAERPNNFSTLRYIRVVSIKYDDDVEEVAETTKTHRVEAAQFAFDNIARQIRENVLARVNP